MAPIVFDKPGDVILGCNIHDHMLAYIYVVESPWFAKSGKEGRARIEAAGGEYDVHLWHFAQASPPPAQALRLRGDETQAVTFSLQLKPPVRRPTPK